MERIKHQLNVHFDYGLQCGVPGSLEVRYCYPHSGQHTREQVLIVHAQDLDKALCEDLTSLYQAMVSKIPPPKRVRLPHAEITPSITPAVLTFVAVDQQRASIIPLARLYYNEDVPELQSRVEGQVRVERDGWLESERAICERLQSAAQKLAWQDYERLVAEHRDKLVLGGNWKATLACLVASSLFVETPPLRRARSNVWLVLERLMSAWRSDLAGVVLSRRISNTASRVVRAIGLARRHLVPSAAVRTSNLRSDLQRRQMTSEHSCRCQ